MKKYFLSFINRTGDSSDRYFSNKEKACEYMARLLDYTDKTVEDVFKKKPYTTYVCNDGSRFVLKKNF